MFLKKMLLKKKRATKGQQQDAAYEERKYDASVDDNERIDNNGDASRPTQGGNLTPAERKIVPLEIHERVLTETGYKLVSTVCDKFAFVVAEGSADSWETLSLSFEGKRGPFEREPRGAHCLICWFARCPQDLDSADALNELIRARDKLAHHDKHPVVASVFFANPTLENDETALDPFQEKFKSLAMKSAVDENSVFVFFLYELWFRDQQGQKMVNEAEAALAKERAAIAEERAAIAEERATLAEERAAAEERVRELEQQLASK